jgi:hypothetical protein
MLKARTRTEDGKVLFVIGLSARNRQLLIAGHAIHFQGSELGQPDAHFLICRADDAQQLELQRRRYADNDPRWLYTMGMDRAVLTQLHLQPATMTGLRGNTSALLVFAGDTEHEMAAMLGIHTQPVASGFRDVFDPLTGAVRRVPEAKPS